jgi:DNA replicative helicase MCM subunit Mcm2 (Cdc46/Mcm family)
MIDDLLIKYVSSDLVEEVKENFELFFKEKPQKERVLCYLKVEKNINSKDLQEVFPDYQVGTLLMRLKNSGLIEEIDKEGKLIVYALSNEGQQKVDKLILNFLDKNYNYQEHLIKTRKEKLESKENTDLIKNILSGIIEANLKINQEGKIIIDLQELAQYNLETVDLIYASFEGSIQIILSYFKDYKADLKKEDIIFKNAHESLFQKIQQIDRNYEGLVYTKGVITSKKESIKLKVLNYSFCCLNPSCTYSKENIISPNKIKQCPKCKSGVNVVDKEIINNFEAKITDIESGVSLPLFVTEEVVKDFSMIGLGDEIEVLGYLEEKAVENVQGQKEQIEKALFINSYHKTDLIRKLSEEEKEKARKFIDDLQDVKQYLLSPFSDYIEKEEIKELILLQQFTKFDPNQKQAPIHLAIMGEPGVGKNELIKISETYFPICDSIVGADITDAGFKGTVNRETGIKEIGLAKKTQNGTLYFNEFDKFVKSSANGKKAASQLLNASITEQEIRLNKAGIKIKMENLDLRHNVIFNPIEESIIETGKPAYHFMGQVLDKSLLSRMIPLYISRDKGRSKKVFDLMLEKGRRCKDVLISDYQNLILYIRGLEVEFTEKAKDSLRNVYEKILNQDESHTISAERIGQILLQLSLACAKMELSSYCKPKHVKKATKIYFDCLKSCGIDASNLEMLFLDKSQEELKTKKAIKEIIIQEIATSKIFKVKNFIDKFDPLLIEEVISELKKTNDYAEFRKGELRRSQE